jgi:hypothetical protein
MKAKERKFKTLFTDILDTSDSNIEDYRQMLAEANDRIPEDIDDNLIYDCMYDDIDCDWENFTSEVKFYDKKHPDAEFTIDGQLGLWWGKPTIQTVTKNTLLEAIMTCIGNDSTQNTEIKEDQYGCLYVDYHHHDGTNQFVIHKIENKRKKNIRFTKEVW